MEQKPGQEDQDQQLEELDTPSTSVISEDGGQKAQDNKTQQQQPAQSDNQQPPSQDNEQKGSFFERIKNSVRNLNIYVLLFALVMMIAIATAIVAYYRSQQGQSDEAQVVTEPLSQEVLDQLEESDLKVGDPKQVLSVEANAIFSGTVLVRKDLEVAGQIKVGGPLNLPGITVSGASNFDEVQINNLQIAGDTSVQGQLNVLSDLSVNGSATFNGTLSAANLSIDNFQTSGDLSFAGHLDAGGGTPSGSRGGALGSGGTSSVSGTDTAGTVNINTGGGASSGCFITVNFSRAFAGTPNVVITPVGSGGASLNYYVTRTSNNFRICTANNPPSGRSFSFDYIVIN